MKKNIVSLVLILSVGLVLSGCSLFPTNNEGSLDIKIPVKNKQTQEQSQTDVDQPNIQKLVESEKVIPTLTTTTNQAIITDGEKQYRFALSGSADVERHFMAGQREESTFFDGIFTYKGLTIYLPHESDPQIIYACDGPLLEGRPYAYCESNGTDYLEQYEFGGKFRQFQTGGGFSVSWKKIFIKKIGGQNIIFEGKLDGVFVDVIPEYYEDSALRMYMALREYSMIEDLQLSLPEDFEVSKAHQSRVDYDEISEILRPRYDEMRRKITSEEYLSKIKNDPKNLAKEREWKDSINSFSVQ